MANLFDFITGPRQPYPVDEKERRRREQLMMPPAPSPTVATPMWNPVSQPPVFTDQASGTVGSTMIAPTPAMRLEDQRRKTRELQDFENNPVKNNDRGWGGRLLDIGRQFLVSAGQSWDKGQGMPSDQRLLGALGGGIAGGVYGGFHPQVDEERQRLYDIGRSQQLEGEIEGQIQRDQARILTDARIQDIPEERRIKELQIESAERAKALAELGKAKYYDPKNPLHVQRVIRAGMDPAQMVAFDDRDPKTIKIGNDVLQLDRADGKWKIAGTRGDLIDWKLPDGRVVSIPADKAAYNATLQQMSAERIASSERMQTQRLTLDKEKFQQVHALANKQYALAEQKYRDAKTEAERQAARELMQDALTRIDKIMMDSDMDEATKAGLIELQNYGNSVFGQMRNQ